MLIPHSLQGAWLLLASLLAGALNSFAGGGSFLSFPAVLAMGLPPIQANATNTVALWPGQLTSIAGYREDLGSHRHLLIPASLCALVGGLGGAVLLLHTGQGTFLRLVPWLLLGAALLFAVSGPLGEWIATRTGQNEATSPLAYILLFCGVTVICIYIGYFGAGGGFMLMSVLGIFGIEDLRHINALKVVTTTIANGVAVLTFIVSRQIVWRECLLMMVTAALGGYLGARFSRRINPTFMRILIVAIGLAMSVYFFVRKPS